MVLLKTFILFGLIAGEKVFANRFSNHEQVHVNNTSNNSIEIPGHPDNSGHLPRSDASTTKPLTYTQLRAI